MLWYVPLIEVYEEKLAIYSWKGYFNILNLLK